MAPSKLTTTLLALSASAALSVRVKENVDLSLTGLRAGEGECEDKDKWTVGMTNSMGWDCSMYSQANCNNMYDMAGFVAADMCCVCGGGYIASEADHSVACPATCHGYTCDDWVNNGGENTCQDLVATHGCDCGGCTCSGAAYEGNQPDPYYDAGYVTYNENTPAEDDGRLAWVDPRNNYWSMGKGYCTDELGATVPYKRLMGVVPLNCAHHCNKDPACWGYSTDEIGCLLHISPISGADGTDTGFDAFGCFLKATPPEVAQESLQPEPQEESQQHQKPSGDDTPAAEEEGEADETKLDATAAAAETTELSASQKVSYNPLGAVDADMAQVFLFVEKTSTFFLKQRFLPPSYCIDSNEQCHQWASEGYCASEEHVEWMKASCKFSCGFCAPVVQAPPNHAVAKFSKRVMSLHGTTDVTLLGREYLLQTPHVWNLATNWRVTLLDNEIKHSIQRTECSEDDEKKCLAVWKIYKGRTSEEKVIYYGIQRTSTFKFYKSEADFKANPHSDWRAELRRLVPSKKEPASYKVTVMPSEDAGLILLAAYIVDMHQDIVPDAGTSDVGSNNGDY